MLNAIGVRLALGATPRQILTLVLGGVGLCVFGVLAGIAGALTMACVISGVLYGVDPPGPCAYAVVGARASPPAGLFPARRAMRVSPAVALRQN